jgi:hypothetical protein
MSFENRTLKIKLWFNQKKEKEKNWCASDKKLFLFIFQSGVLQGRNGTSIKMLECSNFQIIRFTFFSVASDISDQVGYLHHVPVSWHWF